MEWESTSGLRLNAESLIYSYHTFEGGAVVELTSTKQAPRRVIDMMTLRDHFKDYARQARSLIAKADFVSLDAKVRNDVTQIAEEAEAAAAELDDATHPDNVWASLGVANRAELLQHVHVDNDVPARALARAQGRMRGQKPFLRSQQK